jgi:hypothetical protein
VFGNDCFSPFINIPSFKKHRVDWTTPDEPTIWLGVRYDDLEQLGPAPEGQGR